ncbi:zf-HC2 domain-containing protein [Streptacidiphilus fuscans]|uniref:Zf-HC2 domain-containing protein n=1 Tax=Streptacidiphilus fuscans TaxID=2789292 RepID=A0A931B0G0_9ACTN|nr:zf-HC2 domain-containing protein [Streptacidiphilus fuscans]MBF9068154.1 zf-HC2 domain-containing protein [Streptacidiphilus fuscans]
MNESTVHPDLPSPSAHPDTDALADHIEGLLSPEATAELEDHLASCADCRETHDALLELQELLQAERSAADAPIPDDVAARIDAALATAAATPTDAAAVPAEAEAVPAGHEPDAEAAAGSDEPSGPVPTPSPGAGRGPADNRPGARPGATSRGRRRLRQALVTFAVLVAAGGIGVAVSSGGDIDAGTSSAGPAIGTAPTAPQTSATRPDTGQLVFTDAGLDTQIQGIVRQDAAGQNHTKAPMASLSPGLATASGAATAGTHASPNGNGTGTGSGTAQPTPSGTGAAAEPSASPSAAACVLAAAKQPGVPVHEAVGEYLGVQVFALIYPDTADPAHTWDVFLVQDSCSSPLVLLQRTVPRT